MSSNTRFNDLPGDVILRILGFLEVKDVCKASLVARGWREPSGTEPSGIKRFDLEFCPQNRLVTKDQYLKRWVDLIITKELEDLILHITIGDGSFRLPERLFTSERLTTLHLKVGSLSPFPLQINLSEGMSLPNLKSLFLEDVSFQGDPQNIFSICPVLESLVIGSVKLGKTNVEITSQKLKHLVVKNIGCCSWERCYTIRVNTPNLRSIHFADYLLNQYSTETIYTVVEANFDLKHTYGDECRLRKMNVKDRSCSDIIWVEKLLAAVQNAVVLSLSIIFSEVVSDELFSPAVSLHFPNLKKVNITTRFSMGSIKTIKTLLDISPNVESMTIICSNDISLEDHYQLWYQNYDEVADKELRTHVEQMEKLSLEHLKSVEIRGLLGRNNEFQFLRFLLKCSPSLKEITLCSLDPLLLFINKIKMVPKASSSCIRITRRYP